MNPIAFVKNYWRVLLLVVFVGAALVALFIPGGIFADDSIAAAANDTTTNETDAAGLTNLQYGLGLDGGTRLSAPVVGMTAEDLEIDSGQTATVERTLYDELGVDPEDAIVRYDEESGSYTAEVFVDSDNVTHAEFAAALQEADVDATEDDVRDGVTKTTREEIVRTIETKVNEAGLSGGRVTTEETLGGEYFIVVQVPDMTSQELRTLLSERGVVEVVAHYPENGTQVNETVLVRDDFDTIGAASYNQREGYHYVPVTVSDQKAPEYQQQMKEFGFTSAEGMQNCGIKDPETGEIDFEQAQPNYCLTTVVDDEVVDAHSMSRDLGQSMDRGEWENSPQFQMITPTQQEAQSLSVNLQAGSLRAPLDFESSQTYSIQPALADDFKLYSLFIGVLAVLTVSGVVYLRYTDVRVASPMIVTALSEVVILLGFAAAIRMPLDLSHIAGFVAVIGTGVDDLIIIADEVMSEGDVNSRRVFQSRFRKAFWVIGAAAATTIIALSPLAVLSLGDLRGFAIITILGVLVGVLVTRPAYGDILRYLLTGEK
ncbi:preprotein translocase subunit SecD [Natribaculum luteum]|uniref:Protein-export membrane protein SecD n=1 Tax=Natribaculum luteum TaxID=1586232 RepID=A0ABD5NZB2_9EURY|nr:preprotein translocase subunit SecD [Natribaculum luteum]